MIAWRQNSQKTACWIAPEVAMIGEAVLTELQLRLGRKIDQTRRIYFTVETFSKSGKYKNISFVLLMNLESTCNSSA